MPKELRRDLLIAVAGGLFVILLATIFAAIWSWISAGGLIGSLDGVSRKQFNQEIAEIRTSLDADAFSAGMIVLTDQECAALGENWERYEGMDGRFPLGAGSHTDPRHCRHIEVGTHVTKQR